MATAKSSIQRRLPDSIIDKGLEESLPIGVQKGYFMLTEPERNVLNFALEQYRPGQSEPILAGGQKVLKPALRLAVNYRLVIEEIKDSQVITSYTRWVEAVQVRGTENLEVYLTFSRRFDHIWLELKKLLPRYLSGILLLNTKHAELLSWTRYERNSFVYFNGCRLDRYRRNSMVGCQV